MALALGHSAVLMDTSSRFFFRQEVHPVTLSAKQNHSASKRLNWYPKRRFFRGNLQKNTAWKADLRRRHSPMKRLVSISSQPNEINLHGFEAVEARECL